MTTATSTAAVLQGTTADADPALGRYQQIRAAIEHAAHYLPSQGPITVFIHHNTLHAFEALPFHEAVTEAGKLYGCEPYMPEERYREELARGRMFFTDVQDVITELLGDRSYEKIASLCTRAELQLAMLQFPVYHGPTEELLWFVAETDALRCVRNDVSAATRRRLIAETRRWAMRDLRSQVTLGADPTNSSSTESIAGVLDLLSRFDTSRIENWSLSTWEAFTLQALWRVCCNGVAKVPPPAGSTPPPIRNRELLLAATGEDSDQLINDLLIPFCAAFLDQGLARWQLPRRDDGFFTAFLSLYRLPAGAPEQWRKGLAVELARLQDSRISPLQSIHESLEELGIPGDRWDEYLTATLIALRGWAGMIHFLEERPERAVRPVPPGSLVDYVAVRLILERYAIAWLAKERWRYKGSLAALRDELQSTFVGVQTASIQQRAFTVFQLAQILGWAPVTLVQLSDHDWTKLLTEVESFSPTDRRRVLHSAYERRFQTQVLDSLVLHARHVQPDPPAPMFQATFCIDEREESIRRHIEELAPNTVTYSIAGFYFIDMYYRGATDAHFVPLCPPVMLPKHWVVECVEASWEEANRWREKARRTIGLATHHFHVGSRTFTLSTLISTIGGLLATAPLIARTLFPRLTAKLRKSFGKAILAPPTTRLQLERSESTAPAGAASIGYTVDEMAAIGERVLRDLGLTSNFARLVLMFGHGSTSMNNPHESAHDCGACGGSRGGPSARAIAQMFNDVRVRQRLAQRGLIIPSDTVFVGGMHNTSSGAITYDDVDLIPESHEALFATVRELIESAADRDAHERCRRFQSAPLSISLEAAREHVEGRAEDLSQVRPEWGHATNAVAIVGRRQRTRGLFLDRRAFLNSYDPSQDDAEGNILARILQALVPVCAGINLEYYFSYVDNTGYGSGTKLPHNVTSLLGVMDGAMSDLRTGLPWQMVEIHEPVRLLLIVETSPDIMRNMMARNKLLDILVRNEWIWLAILDPNSALVRVYRDGEFIEYQPSVDKLPMSASSVDWYRGWRGHLEFARIGTPPRTNGDGKETLR